MEAQPDWRRGSARTGVSVTALEVQLLLLPPRALPVDLAQAHGARTGVLPPTGLARGEIPGVPIFSVTEGNVEGCSTEDC